MKVVVSEFSSGFADSSYLLCNYLIQRDEISELTYLSDENNCYFEKTDQKVKTRKLFKAFKTGEKYKKGSIRWLFNRVNIAIMNAISRNRYIKKNKPDITLVMATLSSIDRFFLSGLKKHTKVIMTVHDVIVPQKSLSWGKKSLKKTYEIADGLVVHSQENKKQLMQLFGISRNKIKVIHHGIETEYRKLSREEACREIGIHPDKFTLLFYGGIRESKGLDILLKALKGIDCQLVIAGSVFFGESFERYQRLIDINKISCKAYIEFTSDEFRDYLFQACDYVILPYKEFYSQSGVFMQAIHYRKPVIASDVSSFKSFVKRYHMGYICKPNDIKGLRKTVMKALDHIEVDKNYQENIEKASFENSWEESARKYAKYFEHILQIH